MPRRFSIGPLLPILAILLFAVTLSPACFGAEAEGAGHEEHEALPLYASELFRIGEFVVTNSMFVTWMVAAAIIIFARIAMRNVKPVPTGAQNFWEWLVRKPLRLSRKHHWAYAGAKDLLVLRHHFHFHPVR